MNTEIKKAIAQFLDIDIEDIKEITEDQKKVLRDSTHNLFTMPKYYTDSHIIFTNEAAMKHWQYYAGFEYLPDPDLMKSGGNFIAAYSEDQDNRIKDYLDILTESETD